MVGGLVCACRWGGLGRELSGFGSVTLDDKDQLNQVDDPLDRVTGGKDNDNEDEDSSNMVVSSCIPGGLWKGDFIPDCFVEKRVKNYYEKEGDEAQKY